MRVHAGRALRVGPGDEVIVQGQLASSLAKLGRLYVFASEADGDYAPYVPNQAALATAMPHMMSPMSMRLVLERPSREISFISDIDGFIRVMQEVDTADDPRAIVTLRRKVCRQLPWHLRLSRKLGGILAWIH